MLNTILLAGRLTADPELRRTQNNIAVTSFTLACERDLKNKSTGERETDFIDVVVWRQTAEFVERFVKKGEMVIVKGRLQIRNSVDKDGNKRRNAEIQAESVYTLPRQKGTEGASGTFEQILGNDEGCPF